MNLLPAFVGVPEVNRVYHVDALTLCAALPSQSVDMIFADLPYGITHSAWDIRIPFDPMWETFKRVIKPRGAMVFTASQPFTSMLVMSNLEDFKYDLVYEKSVVTGFLDVNSRPLKTHESILIFYQGQPTYNPQMVLGEKHKRAHRTPTNYYGSVYGAHNMRDSPHSAYYHPRSIIRFPHDANRSQTYAQMPNKIPSHPNQKPVALLEYLIQTYTRPGDLILDPVCGSGTTGIAARNTGRNFIMGDITLEYVDVAHKRLALPFTLPMFETLGVVV